MKKKIISALSIILAAVMLSGCPAQSGGSSAADTVISAESKADTVSGKSTDSVTEKEPEAVTDPKADSAADTARDPDEAVPSVDKDDDNGKIGGEMKVHFLDVGQGDSIFIELPDDKTMLIDASEKEYADKITTYIYSCGYNRLDYVVATHPHSDHIGGMAEVIGSFSVGNVILSPAAHTTKTYTDMLTAIDMSGAKVTLGTAGTELFSDGSLSAVVIAPVSEDYSDLNNSSVMVMLTYGEKRFLFTGDAEEEEERTVTEDVSCDVLKVGHHGSSTSTSSAFLSKANPEYAVISCGAGNSYGHPHTETIDKLKRAGINIYRTDLQGDIVMTCDGKSISVNVSASTADGAASGESKAETTKAAAVSTTKAAAAATARTTPAPSEEKPISYSYVLNTNTMKLHRAGCSAVKRMNESNKGYTNDRDGAIAAGYEPCKKCNP